MSCPFYGAVIVDADGQGKFGSAGLIRMGTSNRCALVTEAHSPCGMESIESRGPEWTCCPRNPTLLALATGTSWPEQTERIRDHYRELRRLTLIRRGLPDPAA